MDDFTHSSELFSLTHLDGRNAHKLIPLRRYFSEFAWMKNRLEVMISYVIELHDLLTKQKLSPQRTAKLQEIAEKFSLSDAKKVQAYEKVVRHDVKALELFLLEKLRIAKRYEEEKFVNLGIGSEDINSIALGRTLTDSRGEVLCPALCEIARLLLQLADTYKKTVMVARTHAQPANVTTFGKEVANTLLRLCDEYEHFISMRLVAKLTGEVGTVQAQWAIDPKVDWLAFIDSFVRSFGLRSSHAATQVAPYDDLVRYLQSIFRLNAILLDFVQNMWLYVLMGYLKVTKVGREVGSAGMPHKVNPIYFEGAEGGLTVANGMIETLVRKLFVNRLQRDFSDSTTRRNVVVPISLSLLSYQSITESLRRIEVDRKTLAADVSRHGEIWAESIKAFGLARGISDMYERLEKETSGKALTNDDIRGIVNSLRLPENDKTTLLTLLFSKQNPYPGYIVTEAISQARKVFRL